MSWPPNNVADAFKDLDENEFSFFSTALAGYRDALMKRGFTRREAIRLVESYSKFIYDMSIEEFMARRAEEQDAKDDELDNGDDSEL